MSSSTRDVHILGVPLDHGAGRRGVGMGPAALRVAGLNSAVERLGYTVIDRGDLDIPAPETQPTGAANAKFLPLIRDTSQRLCDAVRDILHAGGLPLVLGGDHSIAIGTISGVATYLHETAVHETAQQTAPTQAPKLAVVWFDAHGDINTPKTSPSGNIHGMPIACLLGNGPEALNNIGYAGTKIRPSMFAQVGVRDLDDVEKRLLRESQIHVFTMSDIDKRGMSRVMGEAIALTKDADWLHVSFDIDSVDPRVAPGTGTQKLGGLTYREAHLAMEMLADTGRVGSLEMVEVNPTLDDENRTAELAVGLISSALGKRIY